MKRSSLLLPFLFLLSGCSTYMASSLDERRRVDTSLDEMRIEIADLKYALNATKVELSLLEEKLGHQTALLGHQQHLPAKTQDLLVQLASLEKKTALLQKTQEQALNDLQQLRVHANETSTALRGFANEIQAQNKRFEEISKIKQTLASLSKAISAPSVEATKTHRVKPGETLEKIARLYTISVAEIKRANKLEEDRIFVGQELKIP